jgi:fructose-1,6-bisphosphatase/inositol monophosphatase family enzyme
MLIDAVASLLRQAAAEAILPRFQRLDHVDIIEKAPGDLVTVADRHAEAIITPCLLKLLPGARVVGEEACAADPALLRDLDQGMVWLVDPIDGTINFAEGREPFSVMVALLKEGEPVLSWMLDPVGDELCLAERGSGAAVNGVRVFTAGDAVTRPLRGAVLNRFMPRNVGERVEASTTGIERLPGLLCAGAEYPAILRGERDFTIFWRSLPWDHAPGTLFLEEAGGVVRRPDGAPNQVASDGSVSSSREPRRSSTVCSPLSASRRVGAGSSARSRR